MTGFAALEARTNNIGDDIQAIAALQFLPDDVIYVDRDRIGDAVAPPGTRIILNGWFMHSPAKWPPPPALDPLVIGFHAAPKRFEGSPRLEWFRGQNRPVGARDLATLQIFEKAGVDAYWSGCLTLTLRREQPSERSDRVLVVDLDEKSAGYVTARSEGRALAQSTQLLAPSHRSWAWRLFGRRSFDRAARFDLARRRLLDLANAGAVVTSRLHVALPCLAFGTPVLFVTDRPWDPRLESWLPYMRWTTRDGLLAGQYDFDLRDPSENSDAWRAVADALAEKCRTFTGQPMRSFESLILK